MAVSAFWVKAQYSCALHYFIWCLVKLLTKDLTIHFKSQSAALAASVQLDSLAFSKEHCFLERAEAAV